MKLDYVECPICNEEFENVKGNKRIVKLACCNQIICRKCIVENIKHQNKVSDEYKCPYCRCYETGEKHETIPSKKVDTNTYCFNLPIGAYNSCVGVEINGIVILKTADEYHQMLKQMDFLYQYECMDIEQVDEERFNCRIQPTHFYCQISEDGKYYFSTSLLFESNPRMIITTEEYSNFGNQMYDMKLVEEAVEIS